MRKRLLQAMTLSLCCTLGNPVLIKAKENNINLVGVASIFEDVGWETQKNYLKEVVGPSLNMEFVFSGKLANANELTDFMKQSIAFGCTGIINMVTQDDAVAAGANLAEEAGIWYVTQNSKISEDVATLEHNLGHVGASAVEMEESYRKLVKELIEKNGRKSFFIYAGSAAGGDSGKGASSHFHSVKGMLEAIQDAYNLEYQLPVEEIIDAKQSGYVETGRDDVLIYLSDSGELLNGIAEAKEQLGKGKFDTLLTVTSYSSFTGITDEIEKKTGENIIIAATLSDDQMTQAGFETLDSTGDSVLHAGIINPLSIANAKCAVLLSKGLEGKAEEIKEAGHTVKYEIAPYICYDAAQYAEIDKAVKEEITDLLNE